MAPKKRSKLVAAQSMNTTIDLGSLDAVQPGDPSVSIAVDEVHGSIKKIVLLRLYTRNKEYIKNKMKTI